MAYFRLQLNTEFSNELLKLEIKYFLPEIEDKIITTNALS